MKDSGSEAYLELEAVFAQHYHLKRVESVLQWDTAVMLPTGSLASRAAQLAALQRSRHAVLDNKSVPRLLQRAAKAATLSDWQQANLREMHCAYERTQAVPATLRSALAQASVLCEGAWREARERNDFARFAQPFAAVLRLLREKAEHLANTWQCHPYEALMREYDSERTLAQSEALFASLQTALPSLLRRAQNASANNAQTPRPPTLPLVKQQTLCRIVLRDLGFDFNTGRLDQSQHPFTEGGFQDIRVTTAYTPRNACKGLLGAIHEYGHAAYDAGLPQQWHSQPVGQDRGMSMHEGLALFYEMALARTPGFIDYLATVFAAQQWPFDRDRYSTYLLRVAPGCIRIDADELSYPAHIILRYRMEKALLDGSLAINDIPECWNSHMQELFGLQPKTLADGCLQDIHWSMGLLGYFPAYAFGAVYAANLYTVMRERGVGLREGSRAAAQFPALGAWLRDTITRHGAFHPERTLQESVGLFDVPRYLNYLEARYC